MSSAHNPGLSDLAAALFLSGLFATAALAQTPETSNPANTPAARLAPILVVPAPAENAWGPVEGYRATRAASATRTDTLIKDIPQSIAVVPAEVMRDLQLSNIRHALDFAAGVSPVVASSLNTGSYTLRGFVTGAIAYNGFVSRGEQYLHNSGSLADAALLERVEVLKGPASGLYGYSDPGGIVNMVSKRPHAERAAQFYASAGSWDRYRSTVDMNLPLDDAGRVLSRVQVIAEDYGSFRNAPKSERQLVSPSLLWHLGEKTSLLLHSEFSRTLRAVDDGIFPVNGNYRVMDIKTFLGEPNDGRTKHNEQLFQAILNHALDAQWNLRIAAQYKHGTRFGYGSRARIPGTMGAPANMAVRHLILRDFAWHDKAVQAEVVGRFELAGLRHQVLAGVEIDNTRSDTRFPASPFSLGYGIDIYNPVYGQPKPAIPNSSNYLYRIKTRSFNLQDQITFTDRLTGLFGVRTEHFRQYSLERTANLSLYQKHTGIVPRGGLIYKITPETSAFGNVAAAFQPNRLRDNGQILEPEKGLGFEGGFKFDWFDGRLGATVAAFHITKRNLSLPDPNDDNFRITAGEAVSKGVDMQVSGQVTPAFKVIGAYAYTDAKITKDFNPVLRGATLAHVPRHHVGLMGVYSFAGGISTGAALTYKSTRITSNGSPLKLPSYSTVDVFARWDVTKNVNINLNLNNVFDRWYLASGTGSGRAYAMPGEPRNVKLGVTVTL